MRNVKGHGERLTYYDWGQTPFFALQSDQRFSYCLYVPQIYVEQATESYTLIVLIHGTDRTASEYRSRFADFCDQHHCIAIAPLFPVGVDNKDDMDGYKLIEAHGIRYDKILNSMIDEVSLKYRLDDRFLMHGFSGGGHFAHRYLYLHPKRLRGVSVGAPGLVTLLDKNLPFWRGTADFETKFGSAPDIHAIRQVDIQLIVGADDVETWEIAINASNPLWLPGANDAGKTRIERLERLGESLRVHGIDCQFEKLSGIAHDGFPMLATVQKFFASVLRHRE